MLRSLVAAALTAALAFMPAHAQSNRGGAGNFPNVPVVTQDGKTLKFYDDVVKGRRVLVSFIYTNGSDISPLTIARMAQLEDKLGDDVGRDVFFITLTVDPERDTPARLKEYADAFQVGHGWLFLTGQPDDIRRINASLGDKSRSLDDHRDEIVFGNDATGEWMRKSVFGDIDQLVDDIRAMDPQWRDRGRRLQTR
jgi:cytochrome oxidase Cu insertion factor (SCO1/SenC/PrrC family)